MSHDIVPSGVSSTAQQTQNVISELDTVLQGAGDADAAAVRAFQHSPSTAEAVANCIEYLIAYEVSLCREYAETTVSSTIGACHAYVEGDSAMASDSQNALTSIPKLDIPGA